MKFPNKVIRYNESVISKFPIILNFINNNEPTVFELFNSVRKYIEDVTDFIDILDCLFALGKITYNENTRRLTNVI